MAGLRDIFSEYGLIKRRVLVEVRWLQQLAAIPQASHIILLQLFLDSASAVSMQSPRTLCLIGCSALQTNH